jgi:hypothetical protein
MTKLVEALHGTLKDPKAIKLSSAVTDVSKGPDSKITIAYTDAKGKPHTISGVNSVLVTTTANAAQVIDFNGFDLYAAKMRLALAQLHYDSATKVVLFFKKRFWESDGLICGGHSIVDTPSRFIWVSVRICCGFCMEQTSPALCYIVLALCIQYLTADHTDSCTAASGSNPGAIIASYTWGDEAKLFEGLSDDRAIELAKKNLRDVHPTMDEYFVKGIVKRWGSDPYALGAFALFTPLQSTDISEQLSSACHGLYFAGEHISNHHAWIEGSLESVEKAVNDINDQKAVLLRPSVHTPPAVRSKEYDLAVVGGGPIGLAAAYYASKNGKKVLLLEQFAITSNTNGSSTGDTRQFRQMYDKKYLAKLAFEAVGLWQQLERDAGLDQGTLLNMDRGYLFFGNAAAGNTTEGNLEEIKKVCGDLNQNCSLMGAADIMKEFHFTLKDSRERGLFHGASGYLNFPATIEALLNLCKKQGVVVQEKTKITGLDIPESPAESIAIHSAAQSWATKQVVVSPGPFANDAFRSLLGFEINQTIWELSSAYFAIRNDTASKAQSKEVPTWCVQLPLSLGVRV